MSVHFVVLSVLKKHWINISGKLFSCGICIVYLWVSIQTKYEVLDNKYLNGKLFKRVLIQDHCYANINTVSCSWCTKWYQCRVNIFFQKFWSASFIIYGNVYIEMLNRNIHRWISVVIKKWWDKYHPIIKYSKYFC